MRQMHRIAFAVLSAGSVSLGLLACGAERFIPKAGEQKQETPPSPSPSPHVHESSFHKEMKEQVHSYLEGMDLVIAHYEEWGRAERLAGELRQLQGITEHLMSTSHAIDESLLKRRVSRKLEPIGTWSSDVYWSQPFSVLDPQSSSAPARLVQEIALWVLERPNANPYLGFRVRVQIRGDEPIQRDFEPSLVKPYPEVWDLEALAPSLVFPLQKRIDGEGEVTISIQEKLSSGSYQALKSGVVPKVSLSTLELESASSVKRFYIALEGLRKHLQAWPGSPGYGGLAALKYHREQVARVFEETAAD